MCSQQMIIPSENSQADRSIGRSSPSLSVWEFLPLFVIIQTRYIYNLFADSQSLQFVQNFSYFIISPPTRELCCVHGSVISYSCTIVGDLKKKQTHFSSKTCKFCHQHRQTVHFVNLSSLVFICILEFS